MLASLTACQGNKNEPKSEEKEKLTFVLDWTPNTNHTGLYVAQEKGYFSDEGLEVEIVQPPEDGADALVHLEKHSLACRSRIPWRQAWQGADALPTTAVAALVQHNDFWNHHT